MRKIAGFFDNLHFTESSFGLPVVHGSTLRIPVRGLFVLRGHPLLENGDGPYTGWLVFENVRDSRRTVTEYTGESKLAGEFGKPYEVEDGPFPQVVGDPGVTFEFEGLQLEPKAWVDNWIVRADSFELIVDRA